RIRPRRTYPPGAGRRSPARRLPPSRSAPRRAPAGRRPTIPFVRLRRSWVYLTRETEGKRAACGLGPSRKRRGGGSALFEVARHLGVGHPLGGGGLARGGGRPPCPLGEGQRAPGPPSLLLLPPPPHDA